MPLVWWQYSTLPVDSILPDQEQALVHQDERLTGWTTVLTTGSPFLGGEAMAGCCEGPADFLSAAAGSGSFPGAGLVVAAAGCVGSVPLTAFATWTTTAADGDSLLS